MKIVIFAGGVAGCEAIKKILATHREKVCGIVWYGAEEDCPQIQDESLYISAMEAIDIGDVLLSSGYGEIIDSAVLQSFSWGCYNAHPSLLPEYRGRHAIQWALAEGEHTLGVSLHRMTEDIDHGEIIISKSMRFGIETRLDEVVRELAIVAAELMIEFIDRGTPSPKGSPPEKAPYWRRRKPTDSRINWTNGAWKVLATIRSAGPSFPAFAKTTSGEDVIFTDYLASEVPGSILYSSDAGCLVSVGDDGVVWLTPDRRLPVGEVLK